MSATSVGRHVRARIMIGFGVIAWAAGLSGSALAAPSLTISITGCKPQVHVEAVPLDPKTGAFDTGTTNDNVTNCDWNAAGTVKSGAGAGGTELDLGNAALALSLTDFKIQKAGLSGVRETAELTISDTFAVAAGAVMAQDALNGKFDINKGHTSEGDSVDLKASVGSTSLSELKAVAPHADAATAIKAKNAPIQVNIAGANVTLTEVLDFAMIGGAAIELTGSAVVGFSLSEVPIPEPAASGLFGLGALSLFLGSRLRLRA